MKLRRRRASRADGGQATAELALVVPFLGLLLMLIVQLAILVRDQIMVIHAAREGARAAAAAGGTVDEARDAAMAAAGLPIADVDVIVNQPGPKAGLVRVTVRYTDHTNVPLIGALVGDISMSGTAAMRPEG